MPLILKRRYPSVIWATVTDGGPALIQRWEAYSSGSDAERCPVACDIVEGGFSPDLPPT